jgi:hypothetical protein
VELEKSDIRNESFSIKGKKEHKNEFTVGGCI